LVEHHLAKVDVASSSLVNRSTKPPKVKTFGGFCFGCYFSRPHGICTNTVAYGEGERTNVPLNTFRDYHDYWFSVEAVRSFACMLWE